MKNRILRFTGLTIILSALGAATLYCPSEEKITKTVKEFVKAGDHRDVKSLDKILHKDFRAVVNRQFGSDEVSLMNKDLYISLMSEGKIGGDQRSVEIKEIDQTQHNASVKAIFTGVENVFTSYIHLVEDKEGKWKVIDDMPFIEATDK